MRDRQAMQPAQSFLVRLHLIGLRGGVGGHFRHQGHDGIHLRIYALDLFQVRGQRFARRELFRADQLGHLDGARKTNGGIRGLRLRSALQEKCRSRSQQDFAASWFHFAHGRESITRDFSSTDFSLWGFVSEPGRPCPPRSTVQPSSNGNPQTEVCATKIYSSFLRAKTKSDDASSTNITTPSQSFVARLPIHFVADVEFVGRDPAANFHELDDDGQAGPRRRPRRSIRWNRARRD